jgi:hypothetical protein
MLYKKTISSTEILRAYAITYVPKKNINVKYLYDVYL